MNCHYCGISSDAVPMTDDHFVPVVEGGTSHSSNLVPACGPCNSTKGERTVERVRFRLILRRIGWPKFTEDQIAWLRSQGFDMQPYDTAKLWFEDNPDLVPANIAPHNHKGRAARSRQRQQNATMLRISKLLISAET